MKLNLHFPTRPMGRLDEWLGEVSFAELGAAIEAAGFAGVAFPDHPLAPDDWLAAGGHQALDPFVALGAMGAATSHLRLITNLIVASYRSPFVTAKSAASLDFLHGGRMVLGMGAGYLAPEFAAVDADFAGRGQAFDHAITQIRRTWTGQSFAPVDGGPTHTALPAPRQPSGPPIWIGGNSRAARRRAAALGDGWLPFQQGEQQAAITGTDALGSIDEVATAIAEVVAQRRNAGRSGPFDICWTPQRIRSSADLLMYLEEYQAALTEAGVTWLTWEPRSDSAEALLAELAELTGALDNAWLSPSGTGRPA